MKRTLPLIATALLALSACGQEKPEVVGGQADQMAEELQNAAPVELPPAVKASHSYRCKDGSLLFVDFLADDTTANLRMEKMGAVTKLVAPEAGKPFAAEGGYEVVGSGKEITATVPGKAAQTCKG